MRLFIFLTLCSLVVLKSFRQSPIFLVLLLIFIYFVYPEKYIWGIENYRIVLILNVLLMFMIFYHYKHIKIFDDIFSILMLAFLLSFFISSQFALVDYSYAMTKTGLFLKLLLFFLMLKTSLNTIANLKLFYMGCLFSLTFLAAWGVQQYLLGNIRLEGFGGGQIEGSNQLASALVWALPMGYYFMVHAKSKYQQMLYFFCSFTLLIGIICTESRQAFLALLFYGIIIFMASKRKMLFSILFFIIVLMGSTLVPETYWERMETIQNYEEDASATGRLEIWSYAYKLWTQNPILGIGPGNFKKNSPDFFGQERVTHNTYFQILSELGLVGFCLFSLIMFLTILALGRIIIQFRNDTGENSEISSIALMARLGLMGLLICCLFQNKASHEFLYFSSAAAASLNHLGKQTA